MILLLVLLFCAGLQASPADAGSLSEQAVQVVREKLSLLPEDRVEITNFPKITIPDDGSVEFSIKPGQPRQGNLRVEGMVTRGGGQSFRFDVGARVTLVRTAYLLRSDKRRGEPILPGDVIPVTRDITYAGGTLTDPERLDALEAASFIPAGTLLNDRNTRPIPDIRRGDTVTVEVSNGRVRIEAGAEAREDGRVGETILCRNPSSGEVFRAVIRSHGRVSLNLEER